MRNTRLLTYSVILAALLIPPVFGEETRLPESQAVINEAFLAEAKKQQEEKRAEKNKQYLENLIFRILGEDTDTGELPEAGFSIEVNNQNLEKLLAVKEAGRKYILSLLKETKSGYTKERILREFGKESAGKELDDKTIDTLYAVIKDKSSQTRFLTVRLLGENGSAKSIPKINSLLYDSFILRKDVYPVRTAAREAIELINIRAEAKNLSEEDRIKKWLQVIKEKAASRQDYFCEKAVKELTLLTAAKESVWTEVAAAKEMVGKKTLINNKIFSYLLLASANLKDERTLPLIEESFKDISLVNMAIRASVALSVEKTTSFLLKEPIGSGNASLFIAALKEKLAEEEGQMTELPPEAAYSGYDRESIENTTKEIKKILLAKRDNEAYKDAGELCTSILNDYKMASFYYSLYENSAKDSASDDVYSELQARLLLNTGKFAEAKVLSPLIDIKPFVINLKLVGLLKRTQINDPSLECRRNYWLAKTFLDIKQYRNAVAILKKIDTTACLEIPEQYVKDKVALAEAKLKELTEEIVAGPALKVNEELALEISTEKPEYNKDEEIKVKLLFKNMGTLSVKGINDPAGTYGFDILVMKEGRLIKRLKKELGITKANEEAAPDIFTIEPGTALSSELTVFSKEEEKTLEEAEIVLSYVGGPEAPGTEKMWIKHPVVSNELKIKIRK